MQPTTLPSSSRRCVSYECPGGRALTHLPSPLLRLDSDHRYGDVQAAPTGVYQLWSSNLFRAFGRQTSLGRGEESAVRSYGAVIHELLWASSHRGFSPVRLKGTDVVRVGGGRLRRGGGVAAGVGAVAGVALLAGVGGGATTPWVGRAVASAEPRETTVASPRPF